MENYYNIIPWLFIALIIGTTLYCIVKPVIFKEGMEDMKEGFSAGNELRIAAIEYYLENISTLITNPADYALISSNVNEMLATIENANVNKGTLTTGDVQEQIFKDMVASIQKNVDEIHMLLTDTESFPKVQPGLHQLMKSFEKFSGPPY
jgi:hypothetical protein